MEDFKFDYIIKELGIYDTVVNALECEDDVKMAITPYYVANRLVELSGFEDLAHSPSTSFNMMNKLLEMVDQEPWELVRFNSAIHQAFLKGYISKDPGLN